MVGLKFSVHPLFFPFGLYYALTGKIFIFIIYTLSAVVHEIGHSICAQRYGYRLNKITLMPFGAVVNGNLEGMKFFDQVKIALAGPLTNMFIAIFFVAIWWFIPETYAYTDLIVEANLGLALVNLIPCRPLDGGRIIFSLLALRFGEKLSAKIMKGTGLILSLALFALFILSIVWENINISILLFALFALFGNFTGENKNRYIRIYTSLDESKLINGATVKKQAVSVNTTVKKVITLLDESNLNELEVYNEGKRVAILSQSDINNMLQKTGLYDKIGTYLG